MRTVIAAIFLGFALISPGQATSVKNADAYPRAIFVTTAREKYYRTELYFGRSIPDGGMVSDEEWNKFLAEEVTPRFPDGFTILNGLGQYREKSGKIVSEPSGVLVFLYSKKSKTQSRAKIDQIRAAYMKRFRQESVLRVDLPMPVNVSF